MKTVNPNSEASKKPWVALGISRATYYSRKRSKTDLPSKIQNEYENRDALGVIQFNQELRSKQSKTVPMKMVSPGDILDEINTVEIIYSDLETMIEYIEKTINRGVNRKLSDWALDFKKRMEED